MSPRDPIVDELRAIREAIARASGDNVQKIAEAARLREEASGRKAIVVPPRRTRSAGEAS